MNTPTYPPFNLSFGNLLYFFNEIGVHICVKSGFFDILTISTSKVVRFKIKYTKEFVCSAKNKTLFFLSPDLGKTPASQYRCYVYALDIKNLTYSKAVLPIKWEFNSIFLCKEEKHLLLFHNNGQIFRIDAQSLQYKEIMNLDDFELDLKPNYTLDGKLWLSYPWVKTTCNSFVNLARFTEEDYVKICVDVDKCVAERIPLRISSDFARFNGIDAYCYSKNHDIWAYCANNFNQISDVQNNKIRYEFTRYDNLLFHIEIKCKKFGMGRLTLLGDDHIIIYCLSDSSLYLVNLKTWETKHIEIKGKEIMDVFVNQSEGYIIPICKQKIPKVLLRIDDFTPI